MEERVTAQTVRHSRGIREKQDDLDPNVYIDIFREVKPYAIPKE